MVEESPPLAGGELRGVEARADPNRSVKMDTTREVIGQAL